MFIAGTEIKNLSCHSYLFDKVTNIGANHCDTRIFLRRGFKIGSDENGGLETRGGGVDHSLMSIDSNKLINGLHASCYCIDMMFLTPAHATNCIIL